MNFVASMLTLFRVLLAQNQTSFMISIVICQYTLIFIANVSKTRKLLSTFLGFQKLTPREPYDINFYILPAVTFVTLKQNYCQIQKSLLATAEIFANFKK